MDVFGVLFPLAVAFAAGFALRGYLDHHGYLERRWFGVRRRGGQVE